LAFRNKLTAENGNDALVCGKADLCAWDVKSFTVKVSHKSISINIVQNYFPFTDRSRELWFQLFACLGLIAVAGTGRTNKIRMNSL